VRDTGGLEGDLFRGSREMEETEMEEEMETVLEEEDDRDGTEDVDEGVSDGGGDRQSVRGR